MTDFIVRSLLRARGAPVPAIAEAGPWIARARSDDLGGDIDDQADGALYRRRCPLRRSVGASGASPGARAVHDLRTLRRVRLHRRELLQSLEQPDRGRGRALEGADLLSCRAGR